MLAFTSVRQLRDAILHDDREPPAADRRAQRQCPPGDEFHFCKSKSFVMPLGTVADSVADFFAKLPMIPNGSLYFHFLEAPFRLEHATNDFSHWLAESGAGELADAINALDPYVLSLDELKSEIIELGRKNGVS